MKWLKWLRHGFARTVLIVIGLILHCYCTSALATTADLYAFPTTQAADRFAAFTQTVRCLVCQNQTIADSTAPLANDLRNKIYVMMLNNQSDESIKRYLVKRYGDTILLDPPFNKFTFFLWLFPVIFVGLVGSTWVIL